MSTVVDLIFMGAFVITLVAWLLWGECVLRWVVRRKRLPDHKCINAVIDNEIDESHETVRTYLLLFILVIFIVSLISSIDMSELVAAIASKGANIGNIFILADINSYFLFVLFIVALASLLAVRVIKSYIINKAIKCLKDVECK
uniref:Uncharacterized protein n=1 Tax=Candidatus Kentrum sp. LPFa TaxID=2126335 RepID=A0A450WHM7_9GAMM|nr:MAG: hypothetical protein BECKLPF1236B_GA0070989_109714 [Candidatus Kentron sp. LPFa]